MFLRRAAFLPALISASGTLDSSAALPIRLVCDSASMPLVRVPAPFDHPDCMFELKHDGSAPSRTSKGIAVGSSHEMDTRSPNGMCSALRSHTASERMMRC